MIMPIIGSNTFRADRNSVDNKGNYNDPLMRWPLRGAAFTNEVGEALRPLIGEYATLTWVPALLYIGADIYDKYKNNQTEYNPDSRRCLKQAIFQGMASIALPLVAVKAGQNIFSLMGMFNKDKLTINSKEHINKLAQQFVANGKMRAYKNRDKECVKDFLDIIHNNLDYKKQSETSSNPVKKLLLNIENSLSKKFHVNNEGCLNSYGEKTIKDLIELRKTLLYSKELSESDKIAKVYKQALKNGQTSNVAVKTALNKYLQLDGSKGRMVKTLGGFIALGCAIKPIDNFVEHVLIGKIVAPTIEKRTANK